jgi:hypothetical protein
MQGTTKTSDALDAQLDAMFGPVPASVHAAIEQAIEVSKVRPGSVSPARLEDILDELNGMIHVYRVGGVEGEWERDWDPIDFADYARGLPELDADATDDPEGEIHLVGGPVLWFDRGGPSWEVALDCAMAATR